jgi:hypothetical protein
MRAHILILSVTILSCGMTNHVISICKPDTYVSIEELYRFCHIPSPCGEKMQCEGKIARVKGYIDYTNVFHHTRYPQLPYEKFVIHDRKGSSLEIWTVSNDNSGIFEKLFQHQPFSEKIAFIQGTIVGFDMPAMGICHRGMKVTITKADDIYFE